MEGLHGTCGYTALFEHYGDILSTGGLQLSAPEQQYLINVIRTQKRTSDTHSSTTTMDKSNIARKQQQHKVHDRHCGLYAVSPKTAETKPYGRWQVAQQEDDLLWALLASEQQSPQSPSSFSVQEESSAPEVSHVGIVIPYVADEDEEEKKQEIHTKR